MLEHGADALCVDMLERGGAASSPGDSTASKQAAKKKKADSTMGARLRADGLGDDDVTPLATGGVESGQNLGC